MFHVRYSLALLTIACSTTASSAQTSQQIEFFETKIRPVLVASCYKCHSAEAVQAGKLKGGLLLDDREGLRRGGESGVAIVPGNVKKGTLLPALRHEDFAMPPKGKLPKNVIADFTKWVAMGAPDPRDGKGVVQQSIDLAKGRQFWSFLPVRAPTGENVNVDTLVAQKYAEHGLTPVGEASPETLVRRLYFDLIGLPPTPEELDRWTKNLDVGALVDHLLASPRFGERWGRHWLDVARYAESNGNSRNATFPHAWRYRDYVIDALNADTPYDRFLLEQIAGDFLPHKTVEERNRNLVATGFLALGSKPVIRGKRGGFVPDIAADQIEVTTRAVLGMTVACARCHDHKFDPIPTTDYYGLAGIFASSETLYGGGGNAMGGAPATGLHVLLDKDPTQQIAYENWKSALDKTTKRQQEVNRELKKLRPRKGKKNKKSGSDAKPSAEQQAKLAKLTEEQKALQAELRKLRNKPVQPPGSAMGIREASKVLEVPVYIRGESPKGSPISRRFLSVVTEKPPKLADGKSGRLELAQWLASEENPLTARVMVNRIWQHLFGEGIVRTPDNFGLNGDRPSHRELLDWLAAKFVEDGWSVKRMIRRLVLTETYRLSDGHDEKNYNLDPDNIYLWRHPRRRLEAEAIRDAILVAGGTIDLERPEGSVVTVHGGKLIQDSLTPDKIHQPSKHRSVYLPILRNGLPESLEVFDVADPSLVVGRRSVTTVPSQDLFLMNNPFVVENAEAFAKRVCESKEGEDARIELAYRIALARSPTDLEQSRAVKFLGEARDYYADKTSEEERTRKAWTGLCQALFVSAEFRLVR